MTSEPSQPSHPFKRDESMTQPEEDEEHVLWAGTFSARSMTGSWIVAGLVTLVLVLLLMFVSGLRTNGIAWTAIGAALGMLWGGLVGLTLYRKLSQHYEISNQRLMHRDGIFIRKMDRIEMIDIDDVSYQQGPIQSLMNVGSIKIVSSDTSHPELLMPGIADVRKIADLIDDARRAERRKRGVHIESI